MITLERLCAPFPELAAAVAGLPPERRTVPVTGVAVDSRRCRPGHLFVAVPGTRDDGWRFVPQAVAAGAAAVVAGRGAPGGLSVPLLRVTDPRPWPARLAREWQGRPDESLRLAGVTGTNGKTTTATLLRHLLARRHGDAGLLGTIRYVTGRRDEPAPLTTPDGPTLYGLLAEMVAAGLPAAAMEVSSHALDQERTADLALDVAVMTNLGRDHLDYHRTPAAYAAAKARIRELLAGERRRKAPGALVVNADEPAFAALTAPAGETVRFGTDPAARPDLLLADAVLDRDGSRLVLRWRGRSLAVRTRLVGRFNALNVLAAAAAMLAMGEPFDAVVEGLATAPQVPGRLEVLPLPGGATAVVDYAHTPDALAAVLAACREWTSGRLHVVFGAGGDRDRGKRPLMGEVAARLADVAWITSDNPRTEPPEAIIAEIVAGHRAALPPGAPPCRVEPDRRTAITAALADAAPGDTVVVAGKGHEDYQIVGDRRLDLDDRRIVRDWIREVSRA